MAPFRKAWSTFFQLSNHYNIVIFACCCVERESIQSIMIYESTPVSLEYDESSIFSPEEVDVLPQVMGGLENLAKTIALEIKLPEGIDRSRLPKTIDFEFVVQGGQSISHLNLLTEMAGSDKRNRAYYLFFGQVHDTLRSKIASLYPWKRGVKDGKEVLVRMKIYIPTRYMM
mgnify:FL=1